MRSLIDLAASRLALRAPALCAATALPRLSQSAQRLPCGRHVVPTAGTIGPKRVVTSHSVEHGDHLAHHRHDHNLRLLSGGHEAIVERLEHRIPLAGAHRPHVEHAAHGPTATPNATYSFKLAAFESVGSDTDQGCDLLSAQSTELGQECEQCAAQHGSNTWHGSEQPVAPLERRIGLDNLGQMFIEHVDVGGEPSDAASRKPLQHSAFQQPGGILSGDFLGAELAPNSEYLSQPLD